MNLTAVDDAAFVRLKPVERDFTFSSNFDDGLFGIAPEGLGAAQHHHFSAGSVRAMLQAGCGVLEHVAGGNDGGDGFHAGVAYCDYGFM